MSNTFPGGVHPAANKHLSNKLPIGEMPAPKTVYIPINQHIGAKSEIIVKNGEKVKLGQLIAKASGAFSANIFSSVSGVVKDIQTFAGVSGEKVQHVVIENDFNDTFERLPKLTDETSENIIARIREAGIVGMGGAGFPSDIKLKPKNKVEYLLINGAECEPYITCDERIMLEYTEQFVKGVQLLAKALGVRQSVIGVEENKPEAIARVKLYLTNNNITDIDVIGLKVKYPQGAERQLVYAVTKRKVSAAKLPADAGAVVHNVHTALSVYHACWDGQPLFRRIMTVSGLGCKQPANMWVRNGTLVSEIVDYCGVNVNNDELKALGDEVQAMQAEVSQAKSKPEAAALAKELSEKRKKYEEMRLYSVERLICGGPMMGISLQSPKTATTKVFSCLLMLTPRESAWPEYSQCINCGKCAEVCPMNLMPMYIDLCQIYKDYTGAKKYGAMDCIQCGCCTFICPAKRPLVQSVLYAKKIIKEKNI